MAAPATRTWIISLTISGKDAPNRWHRGYPQKRAICRIPARSKWCREPLIDMENWRAAILVAATYGSQPRSDHRPVAVGERLTLSRF